MGLATGMGVPDTICHLAAVAPAQLLPPQHGQCPEWQRLAWLVALFLDKPLMLHAAGVCVNK